MKRVVAVLAVLCMLLTFVPAAVTAETYGDLTYSVSGGKVTITDCADSVAGAVVIPATIAGYPVTTIAISAFEGCTGLTAITIGENVSSVGARAFAGCTALASISVAAGNSVYHSTGNCLIETTGKTLIAGCKASVIPADGSVTAIGNLAFYNCDGLTAIAIPDSILSVGASAFENCAQLANVTIGSNVKTIGNSAFFGCTALTEAVIPDSVTTLGVYVFSGCTALTKVDIGEELVVIPNAAFQGCTALTDVTISGGVATIDIFAFSGCSKLSQIAIGSGVDTIGKFAFYNCGALKTVRIPAAVENIGSNAFAGCDDVRLLIEETNTYAVAYAQDNDIPYTITSLDSLAVTTVTLRPGAAGVYFGSNLSWLAGDPQVLSYGIAVSTSNPLPVADDSDASSLYTVGSTSVLIKDILKTDNTKVENSRNAQMVIYARVYAQKANGEYVYSDAVQVNLKQVVIAAQNKWEDLTTAQQEALTQMYETYADVMANWNIPNLKAA